MKFTILDLRQIVSRQKASTVMNKLTRDPGITAGYRVEYVPFRSKYGTLSTIRQQLNTYEIDEVIDYYENRLESAKHWHTIAGTKRYLKIFYELKDYLSQQSVA